VLRFILRGDLLPRPLYAFISLYIYLLTGKFVARLDVERGLDIDSSSGLWFMTPCSNVIGYQRFGGPRCLHLQGEVSGAWIEIQVAVLWVMTSCSIVVGY